MTDRNLEESSAGGVVTHQPDPSGQTSARVLSAEEQAKLGLSEAMRAAQEEQEVGEVAGVSADASADASAGVSEGEGEGVGVRADAELSDVALVQALAIADGGDAAMLSLLEQRDGVLSADNDKATQRLLMLERVIEERLAMHARKQVPAGAAVAAGADGAGVRRVNAQEIAQAEPAGGGVTVTQLGVLRGVLEGSAGGVQVTHLGIAGVVPLALVQGVDTVERESSEGDDAVMQAAVVAMRRVLALDGVSDEVREAAAGFVGLMTLSVFDENCV